MIYTGLDVHSEKTQIQHLNADGKIMHSQMLPTAPSSFDAFLDQIEEPTSIAFEASGNWWWIYRYFLQHPKVETVTVVDPRRSRKLSQELSVQKGYGRAKNDRIDAEMLGEQLFRGLAPGIILPTPEQMERRSLSRHRMNLVGQSSSIAHRLQSLLKMHGIRLSTSSLVNDFDSQMVYLEKHPSYVCFAIRQFIEQLRLYQQQIQSCEEELKRRLPSTHPDIQLLLSAPGIGIVLAQIIISEIFSIHHFDAPKYLISYAGLAPVESSSAGKKGAVRLNKQCNYFLKYAFIMVAHHARRHPKYQNKYQQDVKKQGKIRAKINLARRLIKAVYWMLTRQQPFQ